MSESRIILIHGPSSAGKTTLARALQSRLGAPFLRFSFDIFMECGVLPMAGIRDGTIDWTRMRPAVFNGFHRCLAALAGAGNNLIVDHIVETPGWLDELLRLLAPFEVFFVGLHCSLEELERRERLRVDRRPGEARLDFESLPEFSHYDLELDGQNQVEANLDAFLAAWQNRPRKSAFEKMVAHLAL